jgi:hypothetical protein
MRTPRKSTHSRSSKRSRKRPRKPPKPTALTASNIQAPPAAGTAPQFAGGDVGISTAGHPPVRTTQGFQRNAFQGLGHPVVRTPHGFLRGGKVAKSEDAVRDDPSVGPISIVPTVYPQEPNGAITGGQNHVTINLNIHGGDFRKFRGTIVDLHEALRGVNAIAPEVREQVIAETSAGTAILEAPKADRGLINLLLIRPLEWLLSTGVGGAVTELAKRALDLLFTMMN